MIYIRTIRIDYASKDQIANNNESATCSPGVEGFLTLSLVFLEAALVPVPSTSRADKDNASRLISVTGVSSSS